MVVQYTISDTAALQLIDLYYITYVASQFYTTVTKWRISKIYGAVPNREHRRIWYSLHSIHLLSGHWHRPGILQVAHQSYLHTSCEENNIKHLSSTQKGSLDVCTWDLACASNPVHNPWTCISFIDRERDGKVRKALLRVHCCYGGDRLCNGRQKQLIIPIHRQDICEWTLICTP